MTSDNPVMICSISMRVNLEQIQITNRAIFDELDIIALSLEDVSTLLLADFQGGGKLFVKNTLKSKSNQKFQS